MQSNISTPVPAAVTGESGHNTIEHLQRSEIYRDYQKAFEATTGLPLAMRAVGSFQSPMQGSKRANAFCTLMAGTNQTCAACLRLQQKVEEEAVFGAKTLECSAGLSESAVPIRVGANVLGYLQTGQVLLHAPTPARFRGISRQLAGLGSAIDLARLKAAYFKTRVLTEKQYGSVINLLSIFAQHLAALSNQVLVQQASSESPVITRAKAFIAEHQNGDLTLQAVAQAARVSEYYFCKLFKRGTGLTLTSYLGRVRVESVKQMLLNRHMRVSEAAYAAGFQSLSQFNRVFRRVEGESPTTYRDRLHGILAAVSHSDRRAA
jgi:AraC-like DNA-binding protein/ligand-binding sensor protein